jgi:prolyl oligopeptidase
VIDPNKLSTDGTTRLVQFVLSKDGKYGAMALSKGGSDWQDILIMDMTTKQNLSDKLEWVKVSGISWQGKGFYYSRYPKPEGSALAAKNENHQVFFHKVGTSQETDELVFEDKANPQRFNGVYATEDEKFAFLSISDRGKGKDGNALHYRALGQKEFKPIISEITDFSFGVIDNVGLSFLIKTNKDAPNDKVEKYDITTGKWSNILPEKPEPLQGVGTAGGKLFATYLKDVTTRAYVYDLKGKLENEVQLPSLGSAGGFGGEADDTFVFYTFSTFNYPPYYFQIRYCKQEKHYFPLARS